MEVQKQILWTLMYLQAVQVNGHGFLLFFIFIFISNSVDSNTD
jgi:hypothetical protein